MLGSSEGTVIISYLIMDPLPFWAFLFHYLTKVKKLNATNATFLLPLSKFNIFEICCSFFHKDMKKEEFLT